MKDKPILIIFAGLIGTGKSTLSEILSKKLDIPIISSDIVRKELSGISPTEHKYKDFEKGIYSKEWTDKTYKEIFKKAEEFLMKDSSVIIDASFKKKSQRKLILDLAVEMGIRYFTIETICKDEEIKKRLTNRLKNEKTIPFKGITGQASDGRLEIYDKQKIDFDVMDDPELVSGDRDSHIIVDTTEPVDVCIEKILERLIHD
ncbi:MAG: AAA family ATPase [Nitrospinae bacterium]|nr:AAA family ATPase [Nitrospinota bacterium]